MSRILSKYLCWVFFFFSICFFLLHGNARLCVDRLLALLLLLLVLQHCIGVRCYFYSNITPFFVVYLFFYFLLLLETFALHGDRIAFVSAGFFAYSICLFSVFLLLLLLLLQQRMLLLFSSLSSSMSLL